MQISKEEIVSKRLEDQVLNGMSRSDLKPTEIWADVLSALSADPANLEKAPPALTVLEYLLLVNPTNAAVERDASTARLAQYCTH